MSKIHDDDLLKVLNWLRNLSYVRAYYLAEDNRDRKIVLSIQLADGRDGSVRGNDVYEVLDEAYEKYYLVDARHDDMLAEGTPRQQERNR